MDDETVDEELMLAYRSGDASGFAALYERYRGPLYRYLLRQCGEQALAETLYTDVWMRVIRAHKRYQAQALFRIYLFHLAHNVLLDHYRHRTAGLPLSYEADPAEIMESHGAAEWHEPADGVAATQQQVTRLLELIAELPEAQREAFLLHEEVGLSMAELARVISEKPETAKNRLRYASQWLRRGMRGAYGDQ